MKIDTYLPIFKGFYQSIYEPNNLEELQFEDINEIRENNNKKPISFDNIDFDYNKYYIDVSKQLCDVIQDELSDYINVIRYKNINSPKYYNYSNDFIECEIEPKKDNILNYIKSNYNDWKKYLKDNYTSYDGFISNYDNNPKSEDWNDYNIINSKHQLYAVLNFISENEGINELDIYDWLVDLWIDVKNYDELIK
tara:strand:- start:1721 stop:2305 length:585 start_codon:yes stop_codon:yes gene_type:complete